MTLFLHLATGLQEDVFLALAAILFRRAEPFFCRFGRGSLKEHFCEIILKSGHWSRKRCHLKVFFFLFLALTSILFSGAEPFKQFW